MRIGIMSDSNGSWAAIDEAVAAAGKVELWLHAGDCCPDAEYLQEMAEVPVWCVSGNCDWPGRHAKEERVVEAGGHRIFLTHGHIYDVRYGLALLQQAAAEAGADIAVYGHTHVADIVPGDVYVLNPGSVARPRDEKRASFMLADLEEGCPPKVKLLRIPVKL